MGRPRNKQRDLALERGESTFNGNPCIYGHDGLRYTIGGNCWHCQKIKNPISAAAYRKTDAGKTYQREYRRRYVADPKNKERLKAINRKYYVKKFFNGDDEAYENYLIEKEEKRSIKRAQAADIKVRRDLRNRPAK